MTRKEKRIRNEQKRIDLAMVITIKLGENLDAGIGAVDAFDIVSMWCNNEIKKNPQERQLYVDAVAIVSKTLNKTSKERGAQRCRVQQFITL